MSEPHAATGTRLWTPQGFREDGWRHADTADALASNERVILPLAVYGSLDPGVRSLNRERIGVLLTPGEMIEAILPQLGELALIGLAFPSFSDGRSFSKAELLRGRHGYAGPLRATGQVLVDQLPHMLRVGFDEFEVSDPVLLARLAKGETGGIDLHYQPAATPAVDGGTYSWRRRS